MRPIHAILAIAALTFTGCNSTPQQSAYRSLGTIVQAVDSARKIYADAINLGMVDAAKQTEIDGWVSEYQRQMNTALTLAQFDYASAPPAELAALASRITTEILILAGKINRNAPTGGTP